MGQAARVLRLTDGRVRQMLRSGELEGVRDHEGAPWRIPMHAVHALRESRPGRAERPPNAPESPEEDRDRVEALIRELGRLEGAMRTRQELTELAESTLREQLQRERERADRLEEELREARERERRGFWARLFGG